MASENYEDVSSYNLDDEVLEQLLSEQSELNFMWSTRDHWAVGVFMSYVWRDGRFWVTLTTQRARMRAIERDPRVSVAVTGVGTSIGRLKSATAKGRVRIHNDEQTKAWFYPALARRVMPPIAPVQQAFISLLDSERRVVVEVVPEKWITFDGSKMQADTAIAMAKVAMPDSVTRLAEHFGFEPEVPTSRLVSMIGLDRPGGLAGCLYPDSTVADGGIPQVRVARHRRPRGTGGGVGYSLQPDSRCRPAPCLDLRRPGCRQAEFEPSTLVHPAGHSNPAAVQVQDALYNGKAQSA